MDVLLTDPVPRLPLAQWTDNFVVWVTNTFPGPFDFIQTVVGFVVDTLQNALTGPPDLVMVLILAAIALYLAGWRIGLFSAVGLLLIISLDLWQDAMVTLSLVIAATLVSLAIGVPIGVLCAQSARVRTVLKPVLDVMQTMPSFVYLIPMAILLGLGNVPALIATVIFSMPPAIRLTMLGIQQVPHETVEASEAFGATTWQTLRKVELPLALPSIMAGVNQVIMLSLSMVVIAALVGAGGLGAVVVTGLSQLDVGKGFVGGVGIVIIAMILDQVTRNMSRQSHKVPGLAAVANRLSFRVVSRSKRGVGV
ncbi:MAG: ABC transporter permease [Chloroflexota bacterium]|nr:MAG: glycine/betaine ABC transporter [Chloroflexota bacterium]